MRNIFLFLSLLLSIQVCAQENLDWWDALHNYPNAAGPFRNRYQNISPGFLGPNALRVPVLYNGKIDNEFWFDAGGDFHRGGGDKTNNFFLATNLPLAKNRVMLFASSIPRESWVVSEATRDLRRMTAFDGKGRNTGDIIGGFIFRVFDEDQSGFLNVTFRTQFKSTTGGNLVNARFSDHGMLNWDAQFSKTLWNNEQSSFLLKWMLGFLTWQTNQNGLPNGSSNLQNDAPLYGIGGEFTYGNWLIGSDISGYHGYIGNRDYPLFWRNQVLYRHRDFGLRMEYNHGLKAWDWNTFSFGVRYYVGKAFDDH
jgi:hypothetical protein